MPTPQPIVEDFPRPSVPFFFQGLERISDRSLWLFVSLIAFGVYANSLGNGFAYDDLVSVEQNQLIVSLGNTWKIFTTGYWQQWIGATSSYRPLFTFSLALNHAVGGLNPFGYHLANVLLHCANCALFFILARKYGLPKSFALLAALIFAVHPVHTEAVSNVVGRMEVMGTFFCGLAWLFWKRNPERSIPAAKELVAAAFFFLCALFSKENFILFPAGLFLAEWLSRPDVPGFGKLPRLIGPYFVFVPSVIIYLGFRLLSGEGFSRVTQLASPTVEFSLLQRCATMSSVSLQWYRVLVAGYPLRPTYDQFNLEVVKQPTVSSWLGFGIFVLLMTLAVVALRKRPIVSFSILFLFSQMALFNGILIPLYTLFGERWLYLPSVGFCLLFAEGLMALSSHSEKGRDFTRIAAVLSLSLICVYGGFTVRRNGDWKDNHRLFTRFIETDPDNPTGYIQIAGIVGEKNPELARTLLTKALLLSPGEPEALIRLAKINLLENNFRDAEEQADAVIAVEKSDSSQSKSIASMSHLVKAGALLARGDRLNGQKELEICVGFAPWGFEDRLLVGNLLLRNQKNEEAAIVFASVTRTNPDLPKAFNNLGVALLRAGRLEEARKAFESTLRLVPNHDQARRNLQFIENGLKTTPKQTAP